MSKTDQVNGQFAMPYNLTHYMTINDVESPRDAVQFLNQECLNSGLSTTLVTLIGGLVGFQLLLKRVHHRIPIQREYLFGVTSVSTIIVSYFAGVVAKKRCEADLKKQIAEKLGA